MGNKASRDALEGRAAVITGANDKIGLAVTKKLLEYGMTVIGIDGKTDNLDVSLVSNFYSYYFLKERYCNIWRYFSRAVGTSIYNCKDIQYMLLVKNYVQYIF